tara:strand:+ start:21 stop:410 length:390 start_codon:yes stop_codon:yes gene_type:complete
MSDQGLVFKITEDFKNGVRNWVEIDDQIKELKAAIKELTALKKERQEEMVSFVKENNVENQKINITNGGEIKIETKECHKPLTKKYMLELLTRYFDNENKATEIIDFLYSNREVYTKTCVNRSKKRGKK